MIYYLKLNKWCAETQRCFTQWMKIIDVTKSDYFVVCDNEDVKKAISYAVPETKIIESYREEAKKYIDKIDLSNITRWEYAFAAHLTPFLHAYQNNINEFWNIDADDTMLMIPDEKIDEIFNTVQQYGDENKIHAFSFDMHRSNSNGWHWSFGISYITNPGDWIEIFNNFDVKKWQMARVNYMTGFVNFDWFATYLKDTKQLNIQTFYINNIYFMHFCDPFFVGPRGMSLFKDGQIEYPIMKEIYKLDYLRISSLPIAKDVTKFDFNITVEESRNAMTNLLCNIPLEIRASDNLFANVRPYENYKKLLPKLKEKKKYNVVFYVVENAKWKYQSLYDKMVKDNLFNVNIVLSAGDVDVCGSAEHRRNKVLQNKEFFDKRGMKADIGWDFETDKAIDIKKFEPDIIFYQEPYNISPNQDIDHASEFALCMYVPYYINQSEEFNFMGTKPWHKKLYRFYVFDEYWKTITARKLNDDINIRPVSHPILDTIPDMQDGDYVIYASHWSIGNRIGLSSFMENGKFMLEYAKSHPEINFVFTHHPTLKFHVIDRGYYTQEEWDEYISEWKKIGYFPPDGDYNELFAKSRMLISDCGSFRIEYYSTGKPYVYLISSNKYRIRDGEFLEKYTKHYHKVHNTAELKQTLDKLLIENKDEFKDARKKDREEFLRNRVCSADLIIKDIKEILEKKEIYSV